ncbi:unnamed protein product [Prorocentrum cordatum]|uniref:Uncharacterized protein n=1 Tax=Prorocentrum cordatum TaxID=2364126 RepID=A0ABN9QV84_9DINO|nr:unnamed protein product [Polarella glacialis]
MSPGHKKPEHATDAMQQAFYTVGVDAASKDPRRTREVLVAAAAASVRRHPTVPADPDDPAQPWSQALAEDMAVELPVVHCAFVGCTWRSEVVGELCGHVREVHGSVVLPIAELVHPADEDEDLRITAAYNAPALAQALDLPQRQRLAELVARGLPAFVDGLARATGSGAGRRAEGARRHARARPRLITLGPQPAAAEGATASPAGGGRSGDAGRRADDEAFAKKFAALFLDAAGLQSRMAKYGSKAPPRCGRGSAALAARKVRRVRKAARAGVGFEGRLDGAGSELRYAPGFAGAAEAAAWFSGMQRAAAWAQGTVTVFGRAHPEPRLTCYYGDAGLSYRYSGRSVHPLPWSACPPLGAIRQRVEAATGEPPQLGALQPLPVRGRHGGLARRQRGPVRALPDHRLREPGRRAGLRPPGGGRLPGGEEAARAAAARLPAGHARADPSHLWQHCLPRRKKVSEERIHFGSKSWELFPPSQFCLWRR